MRIWTSICGWLKTEYLIDASPKISYFKTAVLLCALNYTGAGFTAENESPDENEQTPDLELLEFLGQFQTDAGEWIAPASLLSDEFQELLDSMATEPDDDSDDEVNN